LILKVLPQYLSNKEECEPKQPLGPFPTDASVYANPPSTGLRVTWFGHSASLIEIDGFRVLIDPVWEERASPFQFMGPKRFFAPTLALEDLPRIDVVLISHDHYDHLGADTVRKLAELPAAAEAIWVTSLGVGERLRKLGVRRGPGWNRVRELNWTQSTEIATPDGRSLTIAAWPARHFSGRWLTDRFTTLWSSFVLEGAQHRVYYGADSGWWDGFTEISAQYPGGFDLTMLEIGAFHPLWSSIHLGPDNAVRAYQAMGGPQRAGLLMPIHWGLFNLALHAWRQPIERVVEIAQNGGIKLWIPRPGRPTEMERDTELYESWWN
jgi:L-ascorbate metabolism protein UlaG (beta-lactamase superfamily)